MQTALRAAVGEASISPRQCDVTTFGDFDAWDALSENARATVAVDAAEIDAMAAYPVVAGHFSYETLTRIASPTSIGTVLREPRARLLSLFAYHRLTPGLGDVYAPFVATAHSMGTLEHFLGEAQIASLTDNQATRLLLHGDARISGSAFIRAEDVEGLAAAALARLRELGFVGVLELGDEAWRGLTEMFGVELSPVQVNVSGDRAGRPAGTDAMEIGDPVAAVDLLERRCAVDRILYETLLADRCGSADEARRRSDAAYMRQLVRLGDVTGVAATRGETLADELARVNTELAQARAELGRARLAVVRPSRTWRLTRPLRSAMRPPRTRDMR
jgi:hypothetical protein